MRCSSLRITHTVVKQPLESLRYAFGYGAGMTCKHTWFAWPIVVFSNVSGMMFWRFSSFILKGS